MVRYQAHNNGPMVVLGKFLVLCQENHQEQIFGSYNPAVSAMQTVGQFFIELYLQLGTYDSLFPVSPR